MNLTKSIDFLLENADVPIRYNLTHDASLVEALLTNDEVAAWLERLTQRVTAKDLANIHGSHDYRYDNIMKKCFILGMNLDIPQFDSLARFFVDFLNEHITKTYEDTLTFEKMYSYRDYETVLACYLPFMGYCDEPAVRYVINKRLEILYNFAKQKRYDIISNDIDFAGVQKEWRGGIVDPELYSDGNIALPSMHDYILLAGAYRYLSDNDKCKAETIAEWLFSDGYRDVPRRFYYYAPLDPAYKAKSIYAKIELSDFNLFDCYILSHFKAAQNSAWFIDAMLEYEQYKTSNGRYVFPKIMITEQKDSEHMNVGENKRSKLYSEIVSTYWVTRIMANGNTG
jgi:hypothetical protein